MLKIEVNKMTDKFTTVLFGTENGSLITRAIGDGELSKILEELRMAVKTIEGHAYATNGPPECRYPGNCFYKEWSECKFLKACSFQWHVFDKKEAE